MKRSIYLLFFSCFIIISSFLHFKLESVKSQKIDTSVLQLKLAVAKEHPMTQKLMATIYNPNSYPIHYWSMSCSQEEMFLVNNRENLRIKPNNMCYHNVPILITLVAHESRRVYFDVVSTHLVMASQENKTLSISMQVIQDQDLDFITNFDQRFTFGKRIISNQIKLSPSDTD